MEKLNQIVSAVDSFVWGPVMLVLLVGTGIFLTIRTRFLPWRNLGYAIKSTLSKEARTKNRGTGDVSPFSALTTALAATIGTGNIVGVATAMVSGGPGALVWMWISALFGITSKFSECMLAIKYREVNAKGEISGGPMYTMKKALKHKRFGSVLGWLFAFFAVVASFGIGNMTQANSIASSMNETFHINPIIIGVILTILALMIIIGGIKSISKISAIVVPFMAIFYVLAGLIVIIGNISNVPEGLREIFTMAFSMKSVSGGVLGTVVASMTNAMRFGVARGCFSNEAGMGSAPNAAATAAVSHPVKQGLIQALSVFTDTLIICSCTAFIILLSDVPLDGTVKGIQLTQMALSHQIGSVGGQFIAICILLFAFSSIVGNYSYCETNLFFISKNKTYLQLYRIIVGGMVMFGSIAALDLVWNIADLFMAIMAITNLIAIVLLGKIALKALQDYNRQRRIRKKNIIFKSSFIPELKDSTSEWE